MGVFPRIVTTIPQAKKPPTLLSVSSSNPDSETESSPETNQHEAPSIEQLIARTRRLKLDLPDDSVSVANRGKYGKRKLRRFMNRDYLLHKIDEEGEEDAMENTFHVMEFRKSPFQRLYETMSTVAALAALDAFDTLTINRSRNTAGANERNKQSHPYMRISRKIRHFIRDSVRKRSRAKTVVHVVRKTEGEILSLRSNSECESTVELLWKNYIQRLMLHAVAQYHGLRSATVLSDDSGTEAVVRVVITPSTTPDKNSPSSLLYDLLRFVYTDALADALADVLSNHNLCSSTEM